MKTRKFFHMIIKNQTVQACVLWIKDSRVYRNMKIARDDSAVKLGCSEWCGLPLNASERASDVIFWGLLYSDDRRSPWWAVRVGPQHDRGRSELSALDLSMIAVVLKPSWWVWILTVMPVWLYFSSFLFCSVSFLNTKLCILRRDQLVISTHDIDTLSNWKVTRTQGYLIKYQILQYDDKCVAENNENHFWDLESGRVKRVEHSSCFRNNVK